MASSVLCMPNSSISCATFTADPMTRPCSSLKQLSFVKQSNGFSSYKQSTVLSSPTKITKAMESRLARVWREIQGLNNWDNLVEPLDSLLREEIIRYGEFVTACYQAFDLDPESKRYLNCKYGKKNVLREVGLGDSGYEVTKYIYATPDINIPTQNDSCCGRWIGYVAMSKDEEVRRLGRRDILITFRGTVTNSEWVANLMSSLTPARLDPNSDRPDVMVEAGFLSLYTSNDSASKFGIQSCREQLLSEISRILNKFKGEEISITLAGHSMGSSLALLLAYDISELGLNKDVSGNKDVPVTVFSFGGPRVGNSGFKERCEELGVKVLRIVNVNDPITKIPGVLFNENFRVFRGRFEFPWSCSCYAHVGVELVLNFFKMHNPSCVHDLETYISLLKCPKSLQVQSEGIDLIHRAKKFLLSAQSFEALQWRDAALSMVNLVQSQWT
ncbi:galactolipase DONGLE, chloroplastic-like [Olea europaea subsp. europaea]|uniref:Galactolipase DONGLE, chloroplastic-like n=1 Tax=Olea europaea subsp. europaea TaxID=158383 RepID=A0A8S0SRP7_OLEEU|nr:galactolipase DONGLE, chloroplastic-like [Olea europaea subsp. europaea]